MRNDNVKKKSRRSERSNRFTLNSRFFFMSKLARCFRKCRVRPFTIKCFKSEPSLSNLIIEIWKPFVLLFFVLFKILDAWTTKMQLLHCVHTSFQRIHHKERNVWQCPLTSSYLWNLKKTVYNVKKVIWRNSYLRNQMIQGWPLRWVCTFSNGWPRHKKDHWQSCDAFSWKKCKNLLARLRIKYLEQEFESCMVKQKTCGSLKIFFIKGQSTFFLTNYTISFDQHYISFVITQPFYSRLILECNWSRFSCLACR